MATSNLTQVARPYIDRMVEVGFELMDVHIPYRLELWYARGPKPVRVWAAYDDKENVWLLRPGDDLCNAPIFRDVDALVVWLKVEGRLRSGQHP